ncbi:MAG: ATP-dependent DNA helicase [Spirochaetes bacterium]|nr:ATP-dependent DNA helicase [Spirochaetota bacterium]
MPSYIDLNKYQCAAVEMISGPLLIIAGPGAGKTKTLVERVIHLIVDEKVEARAILVATFTEKAAKELITRVSNRAVELAVDINLAEMYIGTLHSIFLRIIEEHRPKTTLLRNYRLLDEFEQKYLLHRSLAAFQAIEGYDTLITRQTKRWDQAESLAELVNKAAEDDLDHARLISSPSTELAVLGRITQLYRTKLIEANALDFSTIQLTMWRLISENSDVLEELRGSFGYLMVDEYQDTNAIQEKILLKLAAPRNRICVVGDDDQSLYRFRGATVRNILEFQSNFAPGECGKVELVTNYRSHPGIIDFYNRWMLSMPSKGSWVGDSGETYRHPKSILPREADFPVYESVVKVAGHETQESWNEEVLAFIKALRERGILRDNNQLAFLFKSVKGEKAIGLANYLEANGIPVFSPRSKLFFQREEVILAIGALVFIFPGLIEKHLKWNAEAHLDEWTYYQSCLTRFTMVLRSDTDTHKELRLWCARKAKAHTSLVENTNYTYTDLLYSLLAFPMFSRYVDVELDTGAKDLRPVYNLALLSQLLTRFEYLHNVIVIGKDSLTQDLRSLFNYYLRFLFDGGIGEYEDFDTYAPSGCVSFMTIHQSKGLEFPVVLVDSLNAVPRKSTEIIDRALQDHYYDEPPFEPAEKIKYFDLWRLYYTAFSRAQDLLVLTGAENRDGKGMSRLPSVYFKSVYDPLPDWKDAGLDEENLKLENVKPVNIKHEYSFTSHILLYENCPLQYKFFRELEFSPVRTNAILFGTLVHQTIEDAHKSVLAGHPEAVTRDQIALWLQGNYASLSKATRTYLAPGALRAVEKHVIRYVDHASRDWSSIQEAEVPVTLLKSDYFLKGTIDLIRGKDGSVEILDFKTEKKPDVNEAEGRIKLERYRRQLDIYAHIIEERYGKRVSRMHLYYTGAENESPYVSYDFERPRIDKTVAAIDAVVGKIESKDFDHRHIKKTEKQCGGCDVRAFCWREI